MVAPTIIRVVLVDDHRLFRDGMRALFGSSTDIEVVGEAADTRTALTLLENVECDLISLDITMPGPNGIALLRELKRRQQTAATMMLTGHQETDMITDAFAAGATGYALKQQSIDEIVGAVQSVSRRENYLAPTLNQDLLPGAFALLPPEGGVLAILSAREREVFDLIVRGSSNAAAAKVLFISIKTVETHRTRIMRKLDVHNIGELIRLAARHGLLAAA